MNISDLIVADMHYPLQKGADAKNNAGFILISKHNRSHHCLNRAMMAPIIIKDRYR